LYFSILKKVISISEFYYVSLFLLVHFFNLISANCSIVTITSYKTPTRITLSMNTRFTSELAYLHLLKLLIIL